MSLISAGISIVAWLLAAILVNDQHDVTVLTYAVGTTALCAAVDLFRVLLDFFKELSL